MDPRLPIRSIDYSVIFARQMPAMRQFYGHTLGFALHRELSPRWLEYRVGSNILALRDASGDALPPIGAPSLQLAFRVAPAEVASCAAALAERGVRIEPAPPTSLSATARCSSATPTATCWRSMPRSSRRRSLARSLA